MSWKQHFFKPKWQHKNAEIRLTAVTSEQDPEFLSQLLEIAANDTDSRVRCAAIKRLHQLENILKLAPNEQDPAACALLAARIRQLTVSNADDRPPVAVRLKVLKDSKDRDLIEQLANHAPEAQLRSAAIAKVTRQGLLGDCAINDEDSDIRRLAANLVTQHTTLKRVIEGLRTRDKQLYSQLQDRLNEELIAASDPQAVNAEALKVCTELEHLAIDSEAEHSVEVKAQHQAWKRVADKVSMEMRARYERVCERLAAPPKPKPDPIAVTGSEPGADLTGTDLPGTGPLGADSTGEVPAVATPAEPVPSQALAHAATDVLLYEVDNELRPNAKKLSQFRQRLDAAWKQAQPPHADDDSAWTQADEVLRQMTLVVEKQHQLAEKQISKAEKHLSQLVTELENGELHKALATQSRLREAHEERSRGFEPAWKPINQTLSAQQARIRELLEWQHWSNNKVRQRLIDDMEALPAADLHPDALLESVKSLQSEWKSLEQSEQIPGEKHFSPAPWMWRKFSAAGNTAFDTIKSFLDKRSEIQSRHAQSLATFCAELEQLASVTPTDWTALGKAITRCRKKLHDLNNIPPNKRQKLARQLKSALDNGNQVIQDEYARVEKEKMKLIRSASQLIHMPERGDAIAQAKALQSQWKDAGSLWRSKEQELWNQFRAHLDPLFADLKQEQQAEKAATQEKLAAQKALCAEMKDILANEKDLAAQHGRVLGLRDGWKNIEQPDRKLLASFQTMLEIFDSHEAKAEQKLLQAKQDRLWVKSSLLHELAVSGRTASGTLSKKSETSVKSQWPESDGAGPFETDLDKACKKLLAGEPPTTTDENTEALLADARLLAIRLEFLGGLESPTEYKTSRMQYQVDRLAQSMSGETAKQSASEEAIDAEKSWLAMYALPEAEFKAFGARVKKALNAINKE